MVNSEDYLKFNSIYHIVETTIECMQKSLTSANKKINFAICRNNKSIESVFPASEIAFYLFSHIDFMTRISITSRTNGRIMPFLKVLLSKNIGIDRTLFDGVYNGRLDKYRGLFNRWNFSGMSSSEMENLIQQYLRNLQYSISNQAFYIPNDYSDSIKLVDSNALVCLHAIYKETLLGQEIKLLTNFQNIFDRGVENVSIEEISQLSNDIFSDINNQ